MEDKNLFFSVCPNNIYGAINHPALLLFYSVECNETENGIENVFNKFFRSNRTYIFLLSSSKWIQYKICNCILKRETYTFAAYVS